MPKPPQPIRAPQLSRRRRSERLREGGEERAAERNNNFARTPRRGELAPLDLAILRCLQADARQPVVAIARKLNQPESTIRHRLGRLQEDGLVQFIAMTDPLKLGFNVWVQIGLQIELPKIHDVVKELNSLPEVYFVAITSGGYEVMISSVFRTNAELIEFITGKLSKVQGIIRSDTYHYLAITKREVGMLPPFAPDQPNEGTKAPPPARPRGRRSSDC